MHPRTPKRLEFLSETFRQVGAICWAANHLEYQLEVAYSELVDRDTLDETQGKRASSLIDLIKDALRDGRVSDPDRVTELRNLLSRTSAALAERDEVVHTTWMRTNHTKPGHITGQRFRSRTGRHERDWHPDQLEDIRERLEALEIELGRVAYNATRPPEDWL